MDKILDHKELGKLTVNLSLGEYKFLRYVCRYGDADMVDFWEHGTAVCDALFAEARKVVAKLLSLGFITKSKVNEGRYHPTDNGRRVYEHYRFLLGIKDI